MKICNIITVPNIRPKNLTFGHYLNDEKYSKKSEFSYLESDRVRIEKEKIQENETFSQKESSVNNSISNVKKQIDDTNRRISELREKVKNTEAKINSERSLGERYTKNIKENNAEIEKLHKNQQKIISEISEKKDKINKNASKKLALVGAELQEKYAKESQIAINGIKAQFIKKIINPAISLLEGESTEMPSSVEITGLNEDSAKTILNWLSTVTDSNYAFINAGKYKDEFVQILKELSFLANKEYEKNGSHSFTMVEHFETVDSVSEADKKFLDAILENGAKTYHNTIIALTRFTKNANTFTFNETFKITEKFLEHKNFGLQSIIKSLNGKKSAGINLLNGLRK